MKILFVVKSIPYPINTGRNIRTWNFIRSLSNKHEISLLCFDTNVKQSDFEPIKESFKNMYLINTRPLICNSNKLNNLCLFLHGIPWEIQNEYSLDFDCLFKELLHKERFDCIFIRYIDMAQYIFTNKKDVGCTSIVDLDDIETIKLKREIEFGRYKLKGRYDKFRTLLNLNAYERFHKNLKRVDVTIVCSKTDRNYVQEKRWSRNVKVVPNAIDVSQYLKVADLTNKILNNKIILFCGLLKYQPNNDAAIWFIRDVLPLIREKEPRVKLHIVGLNPRKEILDMEDKKNIFVFKNVDSVIPYYQESSIIITPIRIAGGTRIKILEAFACRRPVVSTATGVEGIELTPNEHYLNADGPEEYADACLRLLNNFDLSHTLTVNSYRLLEEKYSTEIIQEQILNVFKNAKS